MTITVKFRRGNTSTSNGLTLANGELYIDTSKRTVVVHDGSTLGGNPLATESALVSGLASRTTPEYVNSAIQTSISSLINSAPTALDTLNELAAALGNDANYASTVTTALSNKQNTLVSGTNIKTINGNSVLGSGDITTSIPQEVWKKSVWDTWYYVVTSSNYTYGTEMYHPNTITLTPAKTGTLEITYHPGDAYTFTTFTGLRLVFKVTSNGETYSTAHSYSNTTSTGSLEHGSYTVYVPVTEASTITMSIGWWLVGYLGYVNNNPDVYLLYPYGNDAPSTRFITAKYVNVTNNTSMF